MHVVDSSSGYNERGEELDKIRPGAADGAAAAALTDDVETGELGSSHKQSGDIVSQMNFDWDHYGKQVCIFTVPFLSPVE